MASSFTVAVTLACVFGVVMFLLMAMIVFTFWFCSVAIVSKNKYKVKKTDLESQITDGSIVAIKSGKIATGGSNVSAEGDIIVPFGTVPRDQSTEMGSNDFHDALSYNIDLARSITTVSLVEKVPGMEFENSSLGMPVLNETLSSRNFSTLVVSPENAGEESKFDSFSRTLMIQHLLEEAIQEETQKNGLLIRKVMDPYSANLISIGGVVVVIKPFFGVEGYEFSCLQPGDLLRVVKFYVKEGSDFGSRSIQLAKNHDEFDLTNLVNHGDTSSINVTESADDSKSYIDNTDDCYNQIYCTGILLNTFLEYDNVRNCLSLKIKNMSSFSKQESELLKDFPLSLVSLETTILTNVESAGGLE